MEGSKTLFCSSKFPWACGRVSLKFIRNLDTRKATYGVSNVKQTALTIYG